MLAGSDAAAGDGDPYMVASASSDGVIRVWDIRTTKKEKPDPVAEACTKSRLTCLAGSSLKCKLCSCLVICWFFLLFNKILIVVKLYYL